MGTRKSVSVAATLASLALTAALPAAGTATSKPPKPRHSNDRQLEQKCKRGGYRKYGFRNQGRCIAYVQKHHRLPPTYNIPPAPAGKKKGSH